MNTGRRNDMKRKRMIGLLTVISIAVSMMPSFAFAVDNSAEANDGAESSAVSAESAVDTSKVVVPDNEGHWLDKVIFGNEESEQAHKLVAPYSRVVKDGALGESARIALATNSYNGSSITFTLKVDPVLQNYFTVKIWSTGESAAKCTLFVGDEHWGHHMYGDHVLLFFGGKNENIDQFTYYTRLIPKKYTEGKTELELTLRTTENYAPLTKDSAPYYAAYTHNQAYMDLSGEKLGSPRKRTLGEGAPVKSYSSDEIEKILKDYRENQIKEALDYAAESKMAIYKYAYHSRKLAISLTQPWSPHKTPEDKRAVIYYLFNTIDNHVRDYYNNVRLVMQGGHQSDWGSYYRELGMTLYLVENLIFDDAIIGQKEFNNFLDEPFETNSVDGLYSIRGVDWDGGPLTRRGAWERCLKASYDHSRYRHAYISNQVFYYGEGCWEAQQGLRIIDSKFYEGQERSDYFLGMILSLCPWLGPEELVGPNGEELDLYNSIWVHNPGVFTTDQTQIVAKGLAKSKLDENGKQIHRMPYGPAYYNLSWWGLGRENTYVTNYGETMNYWPYWFFMTYGHETTKKMNDELLKLALRGFYGRDWMRYTNVDDNGYRGARIEYVLDFRSPGAYTGKDAYYGPTGGNPYPLYAALEWHMVNHEEEYSDPEWDWYWELARECVGYFQQAVMVDFQGIDAGNGSMYPEVYHYATKDRANYPRFKGKLMAGVVAPQTRFEFYTQEEINKLEVNPEDYRSNAWTDVDIMHVSIRDDDQTIFGSMYYANNGYNNIGYMRIIEDNLERHLQIATSGILRTYDYRMRPNSFSATHWADGDKTRERQRFGVANDLLPISYQPGIGTVKREWNELDTPYSGYPELLTARYRKYFIVFNTTRESYGNERTFDVEIPSDFKGDKIEDLVTHEWLPIVNGKVTVNPFRGYVLKLTEDFQKEIKPFPITITLARQAADHIDLTWREGIGAASYGILRSEEEYGEYKEIARGVRGLSYTDKDVVPGKTYYYKTFGINEFGQGEPSWQAKVEFTPSVSVKNSEWRDDRIFTSTGTAEVNGSDVTIKGVDGIGLQCGDDEVVRLRDMKDSFHFVNQNMIGSGTITAKVESFGGSRYGGPRYETGTGKPLTETKEEVNAKRYDYVFDWEKSFTGVSALNGIMMRENLDKNGAHIYLGADADGTIVLRNRTRDSMATQSNPCHGGQKSPYKFDVGNYNIKDYPWLRLARHYGTSFVSAYISKDGKDWLQLGTTQLVSITTFTADDGTDRKTTGFEVFSPMPYVSYIGLVSTENTVFSNVSVSDIALLGGRLAKNAQKEQESSEYDVVVTESEMDLGQDSKENGTEDNAGQQPPVK